MTKIKLKYNLTELHKPVEQRGSYLTVSATVTSMVGQSVRIRGLPFAENLFSFARSAGRIQ